MKSFFDHGHNRTRQKLKSDSKDSDFFFCSSKATFLPKKTQPGEQIKRKEKYPFSKKRQAKFSVRIRYFYTQSSSFYAVSHIETASSPGMFYFVFFTNPDSADLISLRYELFSAAKYSSHTYVFFIREDKEFVFNFWQFLFLNGKEGKKGVPSWDVRTAAIWTLARAEEEISSLPRFIKASEFFVIKSCGRRDFSLSWKTELFHVSIVCNGRDWTAVEEVSCFFHKIRRHGDFSIYFSGEEAFVF